MEEEKLDKLEGTSEIKRDENGRILPGQQSLNPLGRGAGTTLKEYKARKFKEMTDEEKEAWLEKNKVSGDLQWRMAEGQPQQDVTTGGEKLPTPIYGGISIQGHDSDKEDIQTKEEN